MSDLRCEVGVEMKIYDSVLKPCPFCGNKKSVHAYTYKDAVYRQYAVKCNKCGARIMGASTELAIDKWNRRAERKKGKWIYDTERIMGDGRINRQFHCSVCGDQEFTLYSYCPSCGADMR